MIYLSNTLIAPDSVLVHDDNFEGIVFEFFHRDIKFELLVEFGVQRVFLHRRFLFLCPLTSIMQPNFRIWI